MWKLQAVAAITEWISKANAQTAFTVMCGSICDIFLRQLAQPLSSGRFSVKNKRFRSIAFTAKILVSVFQDVKRILDPGSFKVEKLQVAVKPSRPSTQTLDIIFPKKDVIKKTQIISHQDNTPVNNSLLAMKNLFDDSPVSLAPLPTSDVHVLRDSAGLLPDKTTFLPDFFQIFRDALLWKKNFGILLYKR